MRKTIEQNIFKFSHFPLKIETFQFSFIRWVYPIGMFVGSQKAFWWHIVDFLLLLVSVDPHRLVFASLTQSRCRFRRKLLRVFVVNVHAFVWHTSDENKIRLELSIFVVAHINASLAQAIAMRLPCIGHVFSLLRARGICFSRVFIWECLDYSWLLTL